MSTSIDMRAVKLPAQAYLTSLPTILFCVGFENSFLTIRNGLIGISKETKRHQSCLQLVHSGLEIYDHA